MMLNDLGEKDYVWKPTYKLEKSEHPNGLSYYNSYIYLDITINVIKRNGTIKSLPFPQFLKIILRIVEALQKMDI